MATVSAAMVSQRQRYRLSAPWGRRPWGIPLGAPYRDVGKVEDQGGRQRHGELFGHLPRHGKTFPRQQRAQTPGGGQGAAGGLMVDG